MERSLPQASSVTASASHDREATEAAWLRRVPLAGALASVRARLLLLILLPTIALVALTVVYQLRDRSVEEERRADHIISTAAFVAQGRHQSIDSTQTFMTQMTANPTLIAAAESPDTPSLRSACAQTLAAIASSLGPTIGLGLSDTSGDRICASESTSDATERGAVNIADRSDFQDAVATGEFAIGEVVQARAAPFHSVLPVSMPVYGEGREIKAVLRLGADLAEAKPLVLPSDVPPGSELSTIDRNGLVISSSVHRPGFQLLAAETLAQMDIRAFLSATKVTVSNDGIERSDFITRSTEATAAPMFVVLSVPASEVDVGIVDALFPELAIVLAIAAIALAGAWWLGDVLIARRTDALAEAARRMRSGEFDQEMALREDDTEFGQLAGAFNEISQQFRDNIEELERSVSAKDEFLGLVSHELRTPVTTILGNAQVLMNRWDTLDEETRKRALGDLQEDAVRLRMIIENLLLIARLENEQALDLEPIIVRHTIQDLIETRRRRHPDRVYELTMPQELLVVTGNFACIEQIMSNLLNNAEKYSAPGSPISIRIEGNRDDLIVSVEDRGIGLEAGEAESLFTPFYRSRSAAKISGIGLGLSVCQRLVEAQNGRIWARSRDGGGSVFAFSLPIISLEADEEPEPTAAPDAPLTV